MISLVLLAGAWMIYYDIYKLFSPDRHTTVTISVFSDSYWGVQNGYSYRILDDAVHIFEEEHPGVQVEYTSGILKEDYSEWLSSQVLSGTCPDVFLVLGEDFNDFAETGILKNLTALAEEDNTFRQNAYYSSALAYGQYHDIQYALPYECAPKLMFVNKTILDKENIPVPDEDWTWDDLYEICRKVTKDTDGDGTADQFGIVDYTWEEAFESNGISIFNQDGTKCRLTGKKAEEALNFIIHLTELTERYNTTLQDFNLGNVVFQPMSFSQFRAYKPYPLSVKKYSGFEWGCIPMPSGPHGDNVSTLDTLLIAMNDQAQNKHHAWDLMKILSYDTQIQSEIFDYSEGVSVLKAVTAYDQTLRALTKDPREEQDMNLSTLSNAVEHAVVGPRFRNLEGAKAEIDKAISEIIDGNGNIRMEQIIWNRTINRYLANNQ